MEEGRREDGLSTRGKQKTKRDLVESADSLDVSDELATQDLVFIVNASEDSVGDDTVLVGEDSFGRPVKGEEGREREVSAVS